jgi:hypothetical protein
VAKICLIFLDIDEALIGERLQGGAYEGAADVEQRADIGLRQLGTRRQPAIDDRIPDGIADRLRADIDLIVGGNCCGFHQGSFPGYAPHTIVVFVQSESRFCRHTNGQIVYDFLRILQTNAYILSKS